MRAPSRRGHRVPVRWPAPDDLNRRIQEWEKSTGHSYQYEYQYELSIADGWRTGGFASWHLTDPYPMRCECGRDMEPLLRIDSDEWQGDASWRPVEDTDEAEAEFHSFAQPSAPTQITIGRGYGLWVFTCPASFDHPPRLTMQ